jgi:hypothetical protein
MVHVPPKTRAGVVIVVRQLRDPFVSLLTWSEVATAFDPFSEGNRKDHLDEHYLPLRRYIPMWYASAYLSRFDGYH